MRLSCLGWTQERIAKAKGVTQSLVAYRIQCASLPDSVKECFIKKDFLKEGHALELLKLSVFDNLSVWLDMETAMQEIMASVPKLRKSKITAKIFEKEVDKYNGYISEARELLDKTPENARRRFSEYLGQVRSHNQIKRAYSQLIGDLQKEEADKTTIA